MAHRKKNSASLLPLHDDATVFQIDSRSKVQPFAVLNI
jgi:hypothetical protein